MKLIFPWVLYIGVPAFLVLILFQWKKKTTYTEGKKVANTDYIEDMPLYKKLYKEYKILSGVMFISLLTAIAIGMVIMARPAKVETTSPDIRNRDIFLCMDISDSVDALNVQMCDELKEVVRELNGERFGITIFNAKSVMLVPLTTDYEYVIETLDRLEASFKQSIDMSSFDFDYETADWELYNYKYEGTLSDEGSSYIGDGLASCLYSFPDLENNAERSRLIIFTTDNELNGKPYVTVEEATQLCKKNDVRVFAIAPDNVVDEGAFKQSIESTGGAYYRSTASNAFDDLIHDIRKTKTSAMEITETRVTDQPEVLFVCMVILVGIYLVCSKKVIG